MTRRDSAVVMIAVGVFSILVSLLTPGTDAFTVLGYILGGILLGGGLAEFGRYR